MLQANLQDHQKSDGPQLSDRVLALIPEPPNVFPYNGSRQRVGQWAGVEWDDDEARAQELIYGTLEVSPKFHSAPASAHTSSTFTGRLPSVPPPTTSRTVPNSPVQKPSSVKARINALEPPLFQPFEHSNNESVEASPSDYHACSLKVKHRRRTTPEQLKMLEHWFDINPKPDNALREWLAGRLGMTKRNVQVWFQNRYVICFPTFGTC